MTKILTLEGKLVDRLPLHTHPKQCLFDSKRTTSTEVIISCSWCGRRKGV